MYIDDQRLDEVDGYILEKNKTEAKEINENGNYKINSNAFIC